MSTLVTAAKMAEMLGMKRQVFMNWFRAGLVPCLQRGVGARSPCYFDPGAVRRAIRMRGLTPGQRKPR